MTVNWLQAALHSLSAEIPRELSLLVVSRSLIEGLLGPDRREREARQSVVRAVPAPPPMFSLREE
jgi:hypothetical protein